MTESRPPPRVPFWRRPPPDAPWFAVDDTRVRLLRDSDAIVAMLHAVESAEREVLLEMYWVGSDVVGERFREVLTRKARAGVRVKVIYDAVGSLSVTEPFWLPLLHAGGHVYEYHSLWPMRPTFDLARIEERDHRKVLVVDGARAFTGGLNLAVPWLAPEDGGDGWRDDMVEIDGPVSAELRTLFFKTWARVAAEPKPVDLLSLSRRPQRRVWVLTTLRSSRRSTRREYLRRIRDARRSIDIANSYFLPDRVVKRALLAAVARGVRVRVLVPERGDIAAVQYALEALFDELLRGGVELFALPGPVMHAKTAIVDDDFATIGSFNLDERSRRMNLEVNVAVSDRAFTEHVRTWFERDLARAHRVDLYRWRARPLVRRGVERIAHALRRFL